ncbi:MAG: DUF4349 domain-containing protein [Moorellales bacterium]
MPELGEVKTQRVYSEDVTEDYIDLEARVKTLTAQKERLTELLERARTVEDILKVEKKLERVRAERESLSGKLNYLRHRVTYARVRRGEAIPGGRAGTTGSRF